MADSVVAPPSEPPVYRPVTSLAILGFGLGCLYALIVLIGALISFFRGTPLLLPDWLLAAPLAGAILSLLGARQIRNSEGTRAGLKLTQYGLWLSVVCGLTYFAYAQTIVWAVTQQANNFLLTKLDADTGFFPRLQGAKERPIEMNHAFLLSIPPVARAAADPDDARAMRKHFDQPTKDGPGLLYRFRNLKFVAGIIFAGPDVHIEPVAVKDWRFADGSYRVSRIYSVTTREGSREYLVGVQSVEGIEPGERRKWVVLPQTVFPVGQAKLTPLGETIDAYRRSAYGFLYKWTRNAMTQGFDFKAKDATRWEEVIPDDAARASLRDHLHRQFPNVPMQLKKEEEEFIAWEKVDGKIRLTVPLTMKLEPAGQKDAYVAELRVVVQAKDESVVVERNITWEVIQVYVTFAALGDVKGPPR